MKKDYSAIKFLVSEALGEWMNCLYLKWNQNGEMEYDFIHHTDSDGASGITKILESEGSTIPSVSLQKKISELNIIKKFFLLKKFIKLTKPVSIIWKKKRRDITGVASSFYTMRFTQEQTLQLDLRSKEQGVSTNSFLLWALDQAVSKNLLDKESQRKWVCPINMRISQNQRYGNHSASIIMNALNPSVDTTPHFFQEQIRHFLKAQLHWGSQLYSNMARFIGFKGTLYIAKKIKEIGTGVFSNMRNFPLPDMDLSEKSQQMTHRIFIAPSTQVLPVAAGALTWNEKLCLSLQIHPSLHQNEDVAQKIAQNWLEFLGCALNVSVDKYHWNDILEAPKDLIITN